MSVCCYCHPTTFCCCPQLAVGPIGGITPVILAAIKSINGDKFMTIVPWLAVCAGVSLISTAILYFKYPQTNKDDRHRR